MASVSDLARRLRKAGFVLVRHGGRHDIWEHPGTGRKVTVPRHRGELATGIYRSILRDAGLDGGGDGR